MGAITLSLPEDLKKRMDEQDWVNWSSVAREAFIQKLDELSLLEKIKKISEIPENDLRTIKEAILKEVLSSTKKTKTKQVYTKKDITTLFQS